MENSGEAADNSPSEYDGPKRSDIVPREYIRDETPRTLRECKTCGKSGHNFFVCPREYCTNCGKFGHNIRGCFNVLCYRCGQREHITRDCQRRTNPRVLGCWTCGEPGHKRKDSQCKGNPNPKDWFCSYCNRKGVSTEACWCNELRSENLLSTKMEKFHFEANPENKGKKWKLIPIDDLKSGHGVNYPFSEENTRK